MRFKHMWHKLLTDDEGIGLTSSSLLKTDISRSSMALCEVIVHLPFGGAVSIEQVTFIITMDI